MSKDLVLNILLGVAIMVVTHIAVSLIFGDEFLDRSMWVAAITGAIIGYFLYRDKKKFKGRKA